MHNRKNIVLFVTIFSVIIILVGIDYYRKREQYRAMVENELNERYRKHFLSLATLLDGRVYVEGERIQKIGVTFIATHRNERDNYERVVFVLNEEEKNFTENVVVLWPSEYTFRIIDAMNREIIRSEIDVNLFYLEYPITVENVIYDWEKVLQLWRRGITDNVGDMITRTRGEWPSIEGDLEE